ncbi:MAG TPA: sulfite exporter TauE/SafE family protein [Vicinamibacterales bacterium]|nr:sulfite exporter TauE/SafE family protein [Vicinamibacterales bacterium]
MDAKLILIAALLVITVLYAVMWFTTAKRKRTAGEHGSHEPVAPTPLHAAIGFITNFFDTLGIGSFATTTAMFRAWKLVPDEQIPGTLNVGHVLPTVIQAIIYTQLVEVEFKTLFLMIAAACAGAWLGAGLVAGMPRRGVQMGMGVALFGAASIMLLQLLGLVPGGGTALALGGTKLAIGLSGHFVLGALMTLGIGLYAPSMILVSLLGMNPTAAFPIMMGSCAFLMPVGSLQFVRKNAYNLRAAVGLAVGGPLAVLIAAFIVESLPLLYMRWLVVVVVVYTASTMLRAAGSERKAAQARADMTDKP